MLRTLQLYISRELIKTFALTAVGLTLAFSLTGGVFNMMRAEVLTAVQMLNLLTFVLPLSLTLTLPVSALFSCAMVYGRLAADNEFDACRASGVNIHRLLAPALALSVFTAGFTFVFSNYFLPTSIRHVEELVQKDLQKIVVSALNVQGYFRHGPFVVYAGEPPRTEQGEQSTHVQIASAAFMRIVSDELKQVGTADNVQVEFWADPRTGDPIAEAAMFDVRAFDLEQGRIYVSEHQPLDPIAVPMFSEQKTKWLNLTELREFRSNPTRFLPIQRLLIRLRAQTREALFYDHVVKQLTTGEGVLRLGELGGKPKYEIRVKSAFHDPSDFHPQLDRVTVKEVMENHQREYQADRCNVRVAHGFGSTPLIVQLRVAGHVSFTDTMQPGRHEKPDTDLEAVPFPESILRQEQQISDLDLLGITAEHIRLAGEGKLPSEPPPARFSLGKRVENARISTLGALAEQSLEIVGVIHARLAFSACSLVMLVLAAALAIIFRGGQLLTAFIISFLPGMLVVVLNITGRQLSEKPATHLLGLLVIWGGIGLLALADTIVLSKFLRR